MSITVHRQFDPTAVAAYYGLSASDLVRRDEARSVLSRWVAYKGAELAGVGTATRRVDRRVFVEVDSEDDEAFAPLVSAAWADLPDALHLLVPSSQSERAAIAKGLGFATDIESTKFEIPFAAVADVLHRYPTDAAALIVTADSVDPSSLYELDVLLRNDVPGLNGWEGNRHWFDAEMASTDFDPSGYSVAIATDGTLIGLCRFWRMTDAPPSLGLLGVRRRYRNGRLAISLLRAAANGAANWGSPVFTAHSARPALQRRMRRLGATDVDGYIRLCRPAR